MTNPTDESGPGYSPGADDDDVPVIGGETTIDAPLQDGAQELREEAERAREQGQGSRADHAQGPSEDAQRAEKTRELDEESPDEQRMTDF